jgi:hypothetical protein
MLKRFWELKCLNGSGSSLGARVKTRGECDVMRGVGPRQAAPLFVTHGEPAAAARYASEDTTLYILYG